MRAMAVIHRGRLPDTGKNVVYSSVTDGSDAHKSMWVFCIWRGVGIDDGELRDVVATKLNASCSSSDANPVPTRLSEDFVYTAADVSLPGNRVAPWLPCDERQDLLDISSDSRHCMKTW